MFNAVMALLLVLRFVETARPALAAQGRYPEWRAADLRVVDTVRVAGFPSPAPAPAKEPRELLLHIGAEVVAAPVPAAPVDLGLQAEPRLELTTVWQSSSILRVLVMGEPLPATAYVLRFTKELQALDGRVLPAGASVVWATPTVAIRDVVVEDDPTALPGRGNAKLLVHLTLPVDLAAAQRHIALRDPDTGEMLPVQLESVASGGGEQFRLGLLRGELPPMVQVVLGKGLLPKRGSVPLAREHVVPVGVFEPLELVSAHAGPTQIHLGFNRAITDVDPSFVKVGGIEPVRCDRSPTGLAIRGTFTAGSLQTIELAEGFPGRGRSVLGGAVRRTVLVPDREASAEFVGDGEVLSARAEPLLAVRGCNVERAWLRLRRVYENNVVRMLQDSDLRSFEPAIDHEIHVAAARNVEWTERIDLRQVVRGELRGCYQVEVWHPRAYWPDRRLLQISDLGVTVRAGVDGAAVQVVSIADGTPCAGAAVTILTPTNQWLADGVVDADGTALLRWAATAEDRRPFLVQVRHGEDRIFVGMQQFGVELADEGLGGRDYVGSGIEAMVWPSRGIVRPGETIELAALVRDGAGAAAVDRQLDIAIVSPGGKEFRRLQARSPGSGLIAVSCALPNDAPCGRWSARVLEGPDDKQVGWATFEVAAFVPNRLEATVEIAGQPTLGGALSVRIHGNWLDGTPAAARPVVARVRLLHGAFTAKDLPGFTFASGEGGPPPGELPAVEGVLDEHGDAELRFALPPAEGHQALQALVMAEVLDPSGRPVRVRTQQIVPQPGFVLGMRASRQGIDVRAVAGDGTPVDAGQVDLRIELRKWAWDYEPRDGGRWAWRSRIDRQVVHESTVALPAAGGRVSLPELRGQGWLVAVATCGPRRCELPLADAPRAPDRLRVQAGNRPAPGGIAWLDVESPAAGRGFVTLESDTIHGASVVALVAGHNRVAVPVPDGLRLPNLHAIVTLTLPVAAAQRGVGPAWLLGAADLPLQRDDVATPVRLAVPSTLLPQQDLLVQIDAPGASHAVVAVVDEGVLGVTGHPSPDPVGFLLASRALGVEGADTGSRLVADMVFAPRTKTGGDGDDDLDSLLRGGSVDPHIRPLALFAELPLTDGRGEVQLRLPPYEGRVRVMAIAAGRQRVGSSSAAVVVKAPLGLQVAVPRMVMPGDRFVVPVSLRNDLGHDAVVTVDIEAPQAIALPSGTRCEVAVPAGRVATVDVAMVARGGGDGAQSIVVSATCPGASRSVAAEIVVRDVRMPSQEHVGLRLGRPEPVRVAEGWSQERLRAEFVFDVAPDRQLRPALEAMLSYPYGCCEQTASRGMALANCAALLGRMYDDPQQAPAVLPLVQAAVDRLFAMQSSSGGFGWWFGTNEVEPFLTAHVVDFVLQARELGAKVPSAAFERAQQNLAACAATAPQLDLRCHAIELLARLGRPVQPRLDWLCEQPVGAEARASLAAALASLGERSRARALLQHAGEGAAPEPAAGRLSSPFRADALLVRALLAIDPADPSLPGRVAALQQRLLRPQHLTTQESAQGMRAVADYYRRQPAQASVGPVVVLVDGARIEVPPGRAVPLPVRPGSEVLVEGGEGGFGLLSVSGYAPAEARNDERLALHRELVDAQTGLPVQQLQRGRVYEVRIHIDCAAPLTDLAFVDVLPGGCEAEPADPMTLGDRNQAFGGVAAVAAANVEPRDDRVLLFCEQVPKGRSVLRHRIRAVFPGDFAVPALQAQAMYDPTLVVAETTRRRVEIRP